MSSLQIPAIRLFDQQFFHANIKKIHTSRALLALCDKNPPVMRKALHGHDILTVGWTPGQWMDFSKLYKQTTNDVDSLTMVDSLVLYKTLPSKSFQPTSMRSLSWTRLWFVLWSNTDLVEISKILARIYWPCEGSLNYHEIISHSKSFHIKIWRIVILRM